MNFKLGKIDDEVLEKLQSFDWDLIIDFGYNFLNQLDEKQLRFLKGYVVEKLIAKQDDQLKLVRQDHKDFEWARFNNMGVEIKSQFSRSMYTKGAKLYPKYKVNLCSFQGNKQTLEKSDICEIILVIRNDGAFAVHRNDVWEGLKYKAGGIDFEVYGDQIYQISRKRKMTKVNASIDISKALEDFCENLIEEGIKQHLANKVSKE